MLQKYTSSMLVLRNYITLLYSVKPLAERDDGARSGFRYMLNDGGMKPKVWEMSYVSICGSGKKCGTLLNRLRFLGTTQAVAQCPSGNSQKPCSNCLVSVGALKGLSYENLLSFFQGG